MIISMANMKGGVGKTTTACTFATLLASCGYRVLVVDMDPQGNSSSMFLYDDPDEWNQYTISDVLDIENPSEEDMLSTLNATKVDDVFLIRSDMRLLDTANVMIRANADEANYRLKNALKLLDDYFDYMIIDNSPYFNILSINSLAAANIAIAGVRAGGFSASGLGSLTTQMQEIQARYNPDMDFKGVFITEANDRTNIFKGLYDSYKSLLGESFLHTYIRRDNSVGEANTKFIPLPIYSPRSKALNDYKKLIVELHILDEKNERLMNVEATRYERKEMEARQRAKTKKTAED